MRRPAYVKPDGGERERTVQRSAITLLEASGCYAVHVPNGAHLAGGLLARAKQMAALKKDGLRPGFPDLIVFDVRHPGRLGFVEVKRELGGVVSDDQERWAARLAEWGFDYALIEQAEDVLAALKGWGWR